MTTRVIESLVEWQALRKHPLFTGQAIGLVPTMGNLHAGHLSLLKRARMDNDITILSIFVNPTQFNDPKDFKRYPKTLAEDIQQAKDLNIDYVLAPEYDTLYPDNYRYQVTENQLNQQLCGQHRPGHFDGVLTVVLKLLLLAKATRAYFGEKDYQQWQLIHAMQKAFFIDTEIIACPIVRDEQGLALSSRNQQLSTEQHQFAQKFANLLTSKQSLEYIQKTLLALGFKIDYLLERDGRRFAAVWLGQVRLIDNQVI